MSVSSSGSSPSLSSSSSSYSSSSSSEIEPHVSATESTESSSEEVEALYGIDAMVRYQEENPTDKRASIIFKLQLLQAKFSSYLQILPLEIFKMVHDFVFAGISLVKQCQIFAGCPIYYSLACASDSILGRIDAIWQATISTKDNVTARGLWTTLDSGGQRYIESVDTEETILGQGDRQWHELYRTGDGNRIFTLEDEKGLLYLDLKEQPQPLALLYVEGDENPVLITKILSRNQDEGDDETILISDKEIFLKNAKRRIYFLDVLEEGEKIIAILSETNEHYRIMVDENGHQNIKQVHKNKVFESPFFVSNQGPITSVHFDPSVNTLFVFKSQNVDKIKFSPHSAELVTNDTLNFNAELALINDNLGVTEDATILRGIGKLGPYYILEIAYKDEDGDSCITCVMLHEDEDKRNVQFLQQMMYVGEQGPFLHPTMQNAAVCGDFIVLNHHYYGAKLFHYRPGQPLIKPFIEELRDIEAGDAWVDFKQEYYQPRDGDAVGKVLDGPNKATINALAEMSEEEILKELDLLDEEGNPLSDEITIIQRFLHSKGIEPSPWRFDFERVSSFPTRLPTGKIINYYAVENQLLVHTRRLGPDENRGEAIHTRRLGPDENRGEAIHFFDPQSGEETALVLKDQSTYGETRPQRPFKGISGINLKVKFDDGFVFISSSSELEYISQDGTQRPVGHSEIILHPRYRILLSTDIRTGVERSLAGRNIGGHFQIVDFKASTIEGEPIRFSVLIKSPGKTQKYELFEFTYSGEDNEKKMHDQQQEKHTKVTTGKTETVFLRGVLKEELEGPKVQKNESQEEQYDQDENLELTRLVHSKALKKAAVVFSVMSIAMFVFTAMAITPVAVLQPGIAVILQGFSINMAVLITGGGGGVSILVLLATSSVLWSIECKKAHDHQKSQIEVDLLLSENI